MTTENTEETTPDPTVPDTCTLLLAPHDTLDRILVIRSLEGFPTHWMDHYGVWQALPDSLEGMQDLMEQLDERPDLLPLIDMTYVNVEGDDDETPVETQADQVPFGD